MRAIDYFDKGAEGYADRTAIIDGDSRYSYRDLKSASDRIAGAMLAAGIRPEAPVAIYSPNDARVLFCMLGLLRVGGVWVPINYRNAADSNIETRMFAPLHGITEDPATGSAAAATVRGSSRFGAAFSEG